MREGTPASCHRQVFLCLFATLAHQWHRHVNRRVERCSKHLMDVRSDIQVAPSGWIRTEYTHGHQTRQRVLYGRRALAEPSPQHTRRDGGRPMRYIAVCTDRPLYLCSSNRLRYLCRTLTRRFTRSSASSQDSSMSWQKNSIQSSQSPFVETPSNLS